MANAESDVEVAEVVEVVELEQVDLGGGGGAAAGFVDGMYVAAVISVERVVPAVEAVECCM